MSSPKSYLYNTLLLLVIVTNLLGCQHKTDILPEEIKYLKDNPNITVGIYIHYPPYEFINDKGQVSGIIIDYFNKLEKNIGHTFKKKYYSEWQKLISDIKTNDVDIVLEIQTTRERRDYLTFTDPIFLNKHVIVTNANSKIKNIKDLSNKKVCVCKDYSVEEFVRNDHPEIIRVAKANEKSCIDALLNNEVDALIAIQSAINYFIAKEGLTNLKIKDPVSYKSKLGIAINKKKPLLASVIIKGTKSISIQEKSDISKKWLYSFNKNYNEKVSFWEKLSLGIVLLFTCSFLLNFYFKKQVKKRTKELNEARIVAEKNSELKTLFLQNISHEIRTPLNGIIGYTNFLKNVNTKKEKHKYIDTVLNESTNLTNIIDNIIEISDLTTKNIKPNIQPVDINRELNNLYEIHKIKAESKGLNFLFSNTIKAEESFILTDKMRLYKSINNILDNAIKFTKVGQIELITSIKNNALNIIITDSGIGISQVEIKSIFSEFYQEEKALAKKYDGLGIGLSISKENIKSLGGNITLKSNKGKGSLFTINLPIKFVKNKTKLKTKKKYNISKVLITEDMKMNYLLLKKILEKTISEDLEITWAKNGQEAVDLIKENKVFDVIFMDIKMPILNGYDATTAIKKIAPNNIIIAQTSYAHEEDINKAEFIGFDDYLTKPIDSFKLKNALNDLFTLEPSNTKNVS